MRYSSDLFMFHILVIVLCLMWGTIFAWNDQVHRMIAMIAKEHLHPGVLSKIEGLAEDVNGEFPPSFDFVEAACWMNGVSRGGCRLFDSWQDEVVFPLNETVATLRDPKSGAWEKNFCLRILMCCMGNLHHPLHQEKIEDSLRRLWDSFFGTFANDYGGTFEEDEEIEEIMQEINWKFPFKDFFEERQGKFEDWAGQSLQLANIVKGKPLTPEYIQQCRWIALRQIAIAGYHLADTLNEIFDKQ